MCPKIRTGMLWSKPQLLPKELLGSCSHHHLPHSVWFVVEGGGPSECPCVNPAPTARPAPPLGLHNKA